MPALIKNWSDVTNAYRIRNRVFHGRGSVSENKAREYSGQLVRAVATMFDVAEDQRCPLNERLPVRRKDRMPT